MEIKNVIPEPVAPPPAHQISLSDEELNIFVFALDLHAIRFHGSPRTAALAQALREYRDDNGRTFNGYERTLENERRNYKERW